MPIRQADGNRVRSGAWRECNRRGGDIVTARTSTAANILVADDTPENLRLLVAVLSAEGHQVRAVTGGQLALAAAERDPPDLVLLDINMPDMDGYEVCARLKQRPALAEIPVVFLTAMNDVANIVRAFDVGGVDYITKPFQLAELQARVRTHLALRRTQFQLRESLGKLQALEKLRDDMVHMLVHDMRSPLMAVMGHLSMLEDEAKLKLSAEANEDLSAAARGAADISRMANDLIDVSRLEAQQVPIDWREHDLGAIIREVADAFGALDGRRAFELALPEHVTAHCDGGLVRRVIENLLGNAIKHTPSSTAITVSAELGPSGARVTVSDEGPGIPPEARERIFDKFAVAALRRDHRYHSSGLGLAFCRLAVLAHGGRIGVEPRLPRGSVFWFELPGGALERRVSLRAGM
jgi:two-component system, sensor histidine kinase and response regulator